MKPPDYQDDGSRHGSEGSIAEWFHTWRYFFCALGLVGLVALLYAEENWRGYRA